jgi:hypothetical protein
MGYFRFPSFMVLTVTFASATATAQEKERAPALPDSGGPPDAEEEDLQQQLDELRERLRQTEDALANAKVSPLSINGYVDFGFFYPLGNKGVGWVRDVGNKIFTKDHPPDLSQFAWVFLGDILGSPVNTRGEAASLGQAPGVVRFDSVDSNGAPGFIANEINLRVSYQLSDRAIARSSVNFAPRSAKGDFELGDFFDADLAELEYVATEDGNTSIFIGKSLPTFGIEYKERKSDQRFGVTPTLVHRYTSESQLGIKFRTKLLREVLILAGSVTNNSSSTEQFHFHSEIDRNSGKFLNGRAAINIPFGRMAKALTGQRLEIGASGEWGAQDWATDNSGKMWFAGVDLQYLTTSFALKGQWMKGKAPGKAEERTWFLDLHSSGYLELDWQFHPVIGVLARAEQRDALVELGVERAYITKQRRYTGGLRLVFNPHVVAKFEYYKNVEYGGIPAINNDMFTSSLVLAY